MSTMEEMRKNFDNTPYAMFLGMRLEELSPGYAKVILELRPECRNWIGAIHGGLIMSLADQAFGCALNSMDSVYVAAQFGINFLAAPSNTDTLYAEANVVHKGKTLGVAEMVVRNSSDRIIAKATGTAVALKGVKQPTDPKPQ